MATLNESQAGVAFRTALAKLIADPQTGVNTLGYWLARAMGPAYADINDQTWRAVARRAVAAREAGEAMTADPSYTPGRADLNTIPGSTLYAERYSYRVLLTVTGENGQQVTTAIDYRSDTPLSAQQIAAELSATFTPAFVSSTPGRNAIQGLGAYNPPEVTVLAAGRRG